MIKQNLTMHDRELISKYVDLFGRTGGHYSMTHILQEWNANKENWFYNVLDGSFDVKIADGPQLFKASSSMIDKSFYKTEFYKYMRTLEDAFLEAGYDTCFRYTFNSQACLDNKLPEDIPTLSRWNTETNKSTKVFARTCGMRFFKGWKAFVKAINESTSPLFEEAREIMRNNAKTDKELDDMRIELSKISQVKPKSLELHLSIHPLDFMTASDNTNNWNSCMSWKNSGCYRTGTVEMMNSRYVACAYLCDPKKPMHIGSDDCEWNNKLWRAWVYDLDGLTMVGKGYPYDRPDLSNLILDYLRGKETIQQHCVFPDRMTLEDYFHKGEDSYRYGNYIEFYMDWMYNDMCDSCNREFFMCDIGKNVQTDYDISAIVRCFSCGAIRDKEYESDSYCECSGDLSDEPQTWNFLCFDCTDTDKDSLPIKEIEFDGHRFNASSFPHNMNGLYFDMFSGEYSVTDSCYPRHRGTDTLVYFLEDAYFDDFMALPQDETFKDKLNELENKLYDEGEEFMTRFYTANPAHITDERLHHHTYQNNWGTECEVCFANRTLFSIDEDDKRKAAWDKIKNAVHSIDLY